MYMTINAKLCTCIGEYVKKKIIFVTEQFIIHTGVHIV